MFALCGRGLMGGKAWTVDGGGGGEVEGGDAPQGGRVDAGADCEEDVFGALFCGVGVSRWRREREREGGKRTGGGEEVVGFWRS